VSKEVEEEKMRSRIGEEEEEKSNKLGPSLREFFSP
jgi:hypothetical protein